MAALAKSMTVLGLSVAMLAAPTAALAGEIDVEDEIYGGFYSSEFLAAEDIENFGVAATAVGRVTFAGTFHHINENDNAGGTWSNTRELLNEVWIAKATPFANVVVNGGSAKAIAAGAYDDKINEWASHVEQYLNKADGLPQRRVIIAPLQEANGTWVSHGCDPASYQVAFRRFVDIFRDRGIDETRVRWAFAPNGWTSPGCGRIADYYPGDDYVDVLAFSAYNFGQCFPRSAWTPVSWAVDAPIADLTAINPSKPIIVAQTAAPRSCETGDTGGDQAQWVRDLFAHLKSKDNVAGFIWFNVSKVETGVEPGVEMDWRIWDDSGWVSPGWKDGIQRAVYRWPLSDWFRPGPLTTRLEEGTPPCSLQVCDSVGYVDASGEWSLWNSMSADASHDAFFFGNPGDVAFMGDWDGDGVATPGLYRQSTGFAYLRNSNTEGVADITFYLGNPGDLPLVGDFDGDGKDTISVYRPSQGTVYVVNKLGENGGWLGAGDRSFAFGNPGDVPFVGDFDGDGLDTFGLYRPSTGAVFLQDSYTQGVAEWDSFDGEPGDVILAGDWDGDGDDTVAVYRPSRQRVYVYLENAASVAAYTAHVGSYPVATTWSRAPIPNPPPPTRWFSPPHMFTVAVN